MKNKNLLTASVVLLITGGILILSSCSKQEGPAGPQGPAGPAYNSGSIFGFVSLYDQYGVKQATPLKGIKVTIDGTTAVSLTDSTGKYMFSNLSSGTYNLSIADTVNASYAPSKVKSINLVLGPSQHDIHLGQIPTFTLLSPTTVDSLEKNKLDTVNVVRIHGTVNIDTKAREFLVFVGADSSVSSAPANYFSVYAAAIAANQTVFSTTIALTDLMSAGFTHGSTVYFMTYPAGVNYASASEYEDLNTGRIMYNEVGPLPVWSKFVIP